MQTYLEDVRILVESIEATLKKLDSIQLEEKIKKDIKDRLRYSWLEAFNVYDILTEHLEDQIGGFNWN